VGGTRPERKHCPAATTTLRFSQIAYVRNKNINATALDRCQTGVCIIEQDACHKKSHSGAIKNNSSKEINVCCSVYLLISFLRESFFLTQRSYTNVEMFLAVMVKSHYYVFTAPSSQEFT
jgi:CTP:phosphocholine cytidylyltransferase-like protein